jgi:hypothetical protein
MKTTLFTFFCICTSLTFGQAQDDTTCLKQQAKAYLTLMYIKKQFDSASSMLDKRVFLEMKDFYNNKKQGYLTGKVLYNRIKSDVKKYYTQQSGFSVDKFLRSTIEIDNGYKMGYVFYQFTRTLKGKRKTDKTMLVFISEDDGNTWVLQDWAVKWIADLVNKKLL